MYIEDNLDPGQEYPLGISEVHALLVLLQDRREYLRECSRFLFYQRSQHCLNHLRPLEPGALRQVLHPQYNRGEAPIDLPAGVLRGLLRPFLRLLPEPEQEHRVLPLRLILPQPPIHL